MTAQKTSRQIVDAAYEAILDRGDIDAFLADFADDAVMVEAASLPYGGTFTGPAGIKAAMIRVFDYWTDFSYTIEHIVYDDAWVMAYGIFAATATKSGTRVSMPLAEIWKIEGGKVRMVSPIYSDTKVAIDALT
ncbi:nuclear transport factor 2 family protein [Flavisphingomonas formosensis]|uniref:nuclear transport factor 2 family protein n=1 Tax=Flavisphingomonas formosensis TaxID=861534 RepID=UPI0012F7F86F|nr:nuclear transport factor 2 family protein [Sphingomonas formosensis]